MNELEIHFNKLKAKNLHLDMTRGKPCKEQLDLSLGMMDVLSSKVSFLDENSFDVRNYGELDGIPEAKKLMADILGLKPENVIVYGNSSLNIMYDQISRSYSHGVLGSTPWCKLPKIKWICLVPGYDRHFAICERFGIEMISVDLKDDGPDMDKVEELVKDEYVKGIWCVPKYSNPTGVTYSNEVIKRLANLKPAAKDFRIYYDNAYALHNIDDKDDQLLNIFDEAKKANNEDIVYLFTSTSKISFPGSGISVLGASKANLEEIKKQLSYQIISFDKVNQLRHVRFFKDKNGIVAHMKKHQQILKPKFEIVTSYLEKISDIISFNKPKGGYFVTIKVKRNADRVIKKCASCGVKLTEAGATHPYHKDPTNSYIRLAPTYLNEEELKQAMDVIITSIKLEN